MNSTSGKTATAGMRSDLRYLSDYTPHILVPLAMLVGFVLVPSGTSWVTLTINGLAMGLLIFVMASGLTLVFGLMDIINFGHGAFVTVGAYAGVTVLAALDHMTAAPSLSANLIALACAIGAAMLVGGLVGFAFERLLVGPVYGDHLKQILMTMGGLIVVEQLVIVFWGPNSIYIVRPEMLKGAVPIFGTVIETYRLIAVALGLSIFIAIRLVLKRSKIGLIVRAGVENGAMVEAMGYRLRLVFVGVFIVGSALAGAGGLLWAVYQGVAEVHIGQQVLVLIFIVVIIGGLGSIDGCFVAALLVGLTQNYVAFLQPKAALVSTIALMVVVLLWRPTGLLPLGRR